MADKKELYEVLFEEINHKMDIVLEGYSEMGHKFEEARIDRQQIREDLTHKIGFVAGDLNNKIEETRTGLREELKETRECLTDKIKETRSELKETREELGQKIDKIGEIIEDHEIRIETLEKKANVS